MIKVDLSGAAGFFDPAGPDYAAAAQAHRTLLERTGAGKDFTGWLDLPGRMQNGELKQILTAASRIRGRAQALVVVGIGGSYLGAKGAVELLRPHPQPGDPKILFAGNSLSPDALMHLLEELGDLDFDLNVVSKSGTTLEPALAFRMFRGLLEAKYGPEKAKKHIFATTDAHRGVLKHMADEEGWETFVIPDDVGGRYSVLSAVGLLPMAAAGIDVQTVIGEAIEAFAAMNVQSPENPAWQYAAARQHLYQLGKTTEILACYEPSFRFMAEWWKQLYGESEGKNGIGIFPASVEYNADLHSMGQYIQDGPRSWRPLSRSSSRKMSSPSRLPWATPTGSTISPGAGSAISAAWRRRPSRPHTSQAACRTWRCACRSATRPGLPGSCVSSSWLVPFRAICPASIRSISPALRLIRRICSLCLANRRQTEKSYRCSRRENVLI